IIAAAKATGAQAIHPGYGFLSENEAFAKRCEDEGIAFIGPRHFSIAAMGDKIASKKLALEAKVNTIPGWNDAIETAERAVEIAKDIGYPVMIKASAGGGGKGLRVAFNDKEAFEGFTSCRNEARNSFGDDRVFIEKYVLEPRHIEIQVLGDSHGNVIYLNERECSIQRRHQKVIEEAPSPFISDATRKAMGEQAVALAKAVKYQSAGTVEFVVGKDQDFYFLEMNTRLQVEHPVTECITGLDLVELMIRVAAGEQLPITQDQVQRNGWAIECRINAEDPFRNFLPSTGRLVRFAPPAQTMHQSNTEALYGVRVDTGVVDGGEIPMYYDSMIAKLIVHGKDRNEAIAKMREALNGFVIRGISSNIPFQAALLAHPKFVSGDFNTGFIAEQYSQGFRAEDVPHDDADFLVALAAFVRRKSRERAAGLTGQLPGYGVKVGHDFSAITLGTGGKNRYTQVHVDEVLGQIGSAVVTVEGQRFEISSPSRLNDICITGVCNGQPFTAQVERGTLRNPLALVVQHNGTRIETMVVSRRMAELHQLMPFKAPPDMSKYVLSPMPGLLVDVAVQVGQKVQAGERVAVIEAMKMENVLFASADGVVAKVLAAKGESLTVDQPIVEFEK
ncbi:MAG: biotin carboxylase N-terminal domain-containing protein, partial [Hydrogenophaga sp.]|nr:biotin carboxylase N-terminal domain-containing protein [Hydrogenophaga sp.]